MIKCTLRLAFLIALGTGLLGCGDAFQVNGRIGSEGPLFRESVSQNFIPENDLLLSDCVNNGQICLYLKNPVFQEGQLISPNDAAKLKQTQNFSAHLTGLDQSGFIKNSFFDIKSVRGAHLPLALALNHRGMDETQSMALYLNTYYWLNRAHEYFNKNFKNSFGFEKSISVYVDDGFDGWSWAHKSLHLDKDKKSALSADVLLILWGEAQAGWATDGKIYQASSSNHQTCGGDPVGCCQSSAGCSQALLKASGDIFHSMLFPDAPSVGEFYHQSLSGQNVCGKKRDPDEFINVSFSQAFSLCSGKPGAALAMGMVYASLWREVRKNSNPQEVDELFLKVLPQLTGDDTFLTAKAKILNTATTLGFTTLATHFQTAFSHH